MAAQGSASRRCCLARLWAAPLTTCWAPLPAGRRLTRSLSKLAGAGAGAGVESLTDDHRSLLVRLMSKGLEHRTTSEQAELDLLAAGLGGGPGGAGDAPAAGAEGNAAAAGAAAGGGGSGEAPGALGAGSRLCGGMWVGWWWGGGGGMARHPAAQCISVVASLGGEEGTRSQRGQVGFC
jgi:hypothetical protein